MAKSALIKNMPCKMCAAEADASNGRCICNKLSPSGTITNKRKFYLTKMTPTNPRFRPGSIVWGGSGSGPADYNWTNVEEELDDCALSCEEEDGGKRMQREECIVTNKHATKQPNTYDSCSSAGDCGMKVSLCENDGNRGCAAWMKKCKSIDGTYVFREGAVTYLDSGGEEPTKPSDTIPGGGFGW